MDLGSAQGATIVLWLLAPANPLTVSVSKVTDPPINIEASSRLFINRNSRAARSASNEGFVTLAWLQAAKPWAPSEGRIKVAPMTAAEDYALFFESEYAKVFRTVYLVTHSRETAEDVTQEAFIQLLNSWRKVSRYELPEAWIRRVAIRIAIRRTRRESKRVDLEAQGTAPSEQSARDPDVMLAIAQLPPAQRAAVVLFYYEDRPVREIASLLSCSESTARVHLHKARQKLGSTLKEKTDVA
jgi:RNA polymerase sigma factor (sigma-70 family)